MRSSFYLGIGLVVLASALRFYVLSDRQQMPVAPVAVETDSSPGGSIEVVQKPAVNGSAQFPKVIAREPLAQTAAGETKSVEEIISELEEAGSRGDSASFQMIVGNLANPQREIRLAALDATIQFGSRDAIPLLNEQAAKTEDAREKVEILDAAELLALPSLSEIRHKQREKNIPPVVVSK